MNKVSITLNVSKFNKDKITERTYTNNEGDEVRFKEYKVDLIPLKQPKVIKTGEGWVIKKTHFVVEAQTKEERNNKEPDNFVGEGFVFEKTEPVQSTRSSSVPDSVDYPDEDINVDDIPF